MKNLILIAISNVERAIQYELHEMDEQAIESEIWSIFRMNELTRYSAVLQVYLNFKQSRQICKSLCWRQKTSGKWKEIDLKHILCVWRREKRSGKISSLLTSKWCKWCESDNEQKACIDWSAEKTKTPLNSSSRESDYVRSCQSQRLILRDQGHGILSMIIH